MGAASFAEQLRANQAPVQDCKDPADCSDRREGSCTHIAARSETRARSVSLPDDKTGECTLSIPSIRSTLVSQTVAQDKLAGKVPLRQGLWIED